LPADASSPNTFHPKLDSPFSSLTPFAALPSSPLFITSTLLLVSFCNHSTLSLYCPFGACQINIFFGYNDTAGFFIEKYKRNYQSRKAKQVWTTSSKHSKMGDENTRPGDTTLKKYL